MHPQPDVEKVLLRLGIEARLRGRDWWARCPNKEHEDRNPSWHIRDEPGAARHALHSCFSCGFGGTIVDLVGYMLEVDWKEARAWLEESPTAEDRRPIPQVIEVRVDKSSPFRLPEGTRFNPFKRWPSSIREYAESRGLTEEQCDRWRIGYAVGGPLAGRLICVKRNRRGEVRGYSARTFVDDPKRYDEPDTWERSDLGTMFGEEFWRESEFLHTCRVYVTEGALNALAIERAMG